MPIYSTALMGTYEEFLKIFKEGDQNEISPSGRSLLFTALCNTKSKERYRIASFLINKGIDITVMHKKEKIVSFKMLFNIGTPEMEMLPLYQLIFSQPGLPFLAKDKWGLTVIEFARRFNRPIAVKIMEDYVKKYNLKEDS